MNNNYSFLQKKKIFENKSIIYNNIEKYSKEYNKYRLLLNQLLKNEPNNEPHYRSKLLKYTEEIEYLREKIKICQEKLIIVNNILI